MGDEAFLQIVRRHGVGKEVSGCITMFVIAIHRIPQGGIPLIETVITTAQPHQGDEFRLQVGVEIRDGGMHLLNRQVIPVVSQDL